MGNIERCEDRIDIYDYDLEEIPKNYLIGLLKVISSCPDCLGCSGQIELLKKKIAQKEKGK